MANPEHMKILKQGVEAWNRWREENPDLRPDLKEAGLTGGDFPRFDFHGTDLARADLAGADLKRAAFWGADLQGSHLVTAHLGNARLERVNLRGGDLEGATCAHACFEGSDLSDANLASADLWYASLQGADLRCADLTEADLGGANLVEANLNGTGLLRTNLKGATFGGTQLDGVDMRQAQGLEDIRHRSPSTIGVDTLYVSQGAIPEVFLRGAGVPENLIEYLPALVAPEAFRSYSCFISYSHADRPFARRIYDDLQAAGIRCWLDEHDLKPGDRIIDVVNDAIRLHDRILLCCSEASLESWWVKDEVRKAQARERREGRDIIIPIMLDRYLLERWEDGLESDISSRFAADFTGWEHDNAKFEEQFERVVRALRTDEGEKAPEPTL